MNHNDFRDAGYRVFGLLGATDHDGTPLDERLAYKKPYSAGWQHTPDWSDEQWDVFHQIGAFDTGYGVLLDTLLVIDIDARNGGVESYARLLDAIPEISGAGLIVETGSGNGSKHIYFKAPGCALVQHLNDYPGIDFKSSGYVVGPGSAHASGTPYSIAYGSPDDIDDAPAALVALLEKPEYHRHEYKGTPIDVSQDDIAVMLRHVDGQDDYDHWVEIGMCVHHATGGAGFDLWNDWSQESTKYNADEMHKKWHSFGKSANPKTIGTLIYHAEQGGWEGRSVTFTPTVDFDEPVSLPTDNEIDLLRPPGFVGELAQWIESQSRRPRERLAVAAALTAMGNVAGLRYYDERDNVTSNLFTFCVAGSGTGKEAIQQAMSEIHTVSGISAATHGAIKSEQEIMRNIALRHQAAFFIVDEIGIFLQKIKNAQTRGGAAYLEGVIGILMSAYSKANGRMLITGDLKDDIRAEIGKKIAQINRKKDEGEKVDESILASLVAKIDALDEGLVRPFVSAIGFTTPVTFDGLVDFETATNGFIGRSLIFEEKETAPRTKRRFRKTAMPSSIADRLRAIYQAGEFSHGSGVVELPQRRPVPTDSAADDLLDEVVAWFEDQAIEQKAKTGLESLYLRAYELVAKVSFILAIPEGIRTEEHVRWAFALVKRDIESKMHLVMSNTSDKSKSRMALNSAIAHAIGDEGLTIGVLRNKLSRKWKKEDVEAAVKDLVANGLVTQTIVPFGKGGGRTTEYLVLAS
jgi:hypothetical protein